MLQIETSQTFDATKYLGCSFCPLNYNCKKYALICNYEKSKLFFAAATLCTLELAENYAMQVIRDTNKNNLLNALERAQTLYKKFLPALNNNLQAFYKYECETTTEYTKNALLFAIEESLRYFDLLRYFDFTFSQDIETTCDILHKNYTSEIEKSENEKLAEQKAGANNTTKKL